MPTINGTQFGTFNSPETRRSFRDLVMPIDDLAARSVSLVRRPLPEFSVEGAAYHLPRYLFVGPKGGAEPIRVGLFAGTNGTELEGTLALREFVERLELTPAIARDYCLFLYPLLNPTGYELGRRETSSGTHIPSQIWKNSNSPEVQQLQSELWMHGFDGIVSFNTASESSELSIAVGGVIFARHLLGNALQNAQDVLPQWVDASPAALPRFSGRELRESNDLIRAAPGLKPRPFEIVITIPLKAPTYLQKAAVSLILQTVLSEYRHFISYGANI